jgi:hypothetical protein
MPARAGPASHRVRPEPAPARSPSAGDRLREPPAGPKPGGDAAATFEFGGIAILPPAQPIGGDIRGAMERSFGADFSGVRVRADPAAASAVAARGARAFTVGDEIAFAEGQYALDRPEGRRLLAHELAHVVQQRGGSGGAGPADGGAAAEQEAARAAQAVARGAPVPPLSRAPICVQCQHHDTIEVELVGPVEQHQFGREVHRVGENAGPNILMGIELGFGGSVTYRWFNFEAGEAATGSAQEWSLIHGAAAVFARNDAFANLGRQLTPAQWRTLWPDPVPELLRRYEAGRTAMADEAVLGTYRGMVRSTARTQLDENERQIDELLEARDRVARLQEFADGLREAALVRDQLVARRNELQRSLVQAHSFTFGLAGNIINQDPARRLRATSELASVEESLAGWNAYFPLLTRLRTAEINPARVEDTLRTIKANIISTRARLVPTSRGLDPMDLENTRARVSSSLGARAAAVVAAEDQSRRRWALARTIAGTAGMIAILFLPGGLFIDAAIGIAMAVDAWSDAAIIGRAANTGLHVDDGLMTQAQADAARFHAILATIFAVVGVAAAGFRVLRVGQAIMNVRRVLPELEFAQQVRLARALAENRGLMNTLMGPAAQGDAFVLNRLRSAARDLAGDPAALRRSLEVTGALARIPRRVVENDAYAPIRAITDGSDVEAIARLTGLSRQEVAAARQHFMLDEHILVDANGGLYRGRFEAFAEDARLWLNAARGRPVAASDVAYLRRLVRHEVVEAGALAGQRRLIEQAFIRGELEGMLRQFLGRHLPPARVEAILAQETRPIMPFRYAHYVAHFSGAPNP